MKLTIILLTLILMFMVQVVNGQSIDFNENGNLDREDVTFLTAFIASDRTFKRFCNKVTNSFRRCSEIKSDINTLIAGRRPGCPSQRPCPDCPQPTPCPAPTQCPVGKSTCPVGNMRKLTVNKSGQVTLELQ